MTLKNPDGYSKKAAGYFDQDHQELQSLFMKIQELQKLSLKVSAYLEPHLVSYCQIANVAGSKLIVFVANGSIATQLRFQTTDLLKKFSLDPGLKHIRQIDYKVHPKLAQPSDSRSSQKKMQPLSRETADIIRNMAETLEDQALREIMERIASRIRVG
jgi:hypothetical protein